MAGRLVVFALLTAFVGQSVAAQDPGDDPKSILRDPGKFLAEAQWVARALDLDAGDFASPGARLSNRQEINRLIVTKLTAYCLNHAHYEVGDVPLDARNRPSQFRAMQEANNMITMQQWRYCETQETDAYRTFISGAEIQNVDPTIIRDCRRIPDQDSYVEVLNCIRYERASR